MEVGQLIGYKRMLGVLALLYISKWGGILAQYVDKSAGLSILGGHLDFLIMYIYTINKKGNITLLIVNAQK